MGIRFRKSIGLGEGLRLNIGKKSMGVSAGVPGAHVTYSTSGRKTTSVGIPGSGISYVKSETTGKKGGKIFGNGTGKKNGCWIAVIIFIALCFIGSICRACSGGGTSSSASSMSSTNFMDSAASISFTSSINDSSLTVSSSDTVSSNITPSAETSSSPEAASNVSQTVETSSEDKASSAKPVEAPAPDTSAITITSAPGTVQAGSNATISIHGKPNTSYSVSVYYSTTKSTADGLVKKNSDSNGDVSWTWKVSPNTNAGSHKIVIEGGGDKIQTEFTTTK